MTGKDRVDRSDLREDNISELRCRCMCMCVLLFFSFDEEFFHFSDSVYSLTLSLASLLYHPALHP